MLVALEEEVRGRFAHLQLTGGPEAGRDAEALVAGAGTSRPASARVSVMISVDAVDAAGSTGITAVGALRRAAGITNGGALSLRGISIGMSTGIGRG